MSKRLHWISQDHPYTATSDKLAGWARVVENCACLWVKIPHIWKSGGSILAGAVLALFHTGERRERKI